MKKHNKKLLVALAVAALSSVAMVPMAYAARSDNSVTCSDSIDYGKKFAVGSGCTSSNSSLNFQGVMNVTLSDNNVVYSCKHGAFTSNDGGYVLAYDCAGNSLK